MTLRLKIILMLFLSILSYTQVCGKTEEEAQRPALDNLVINPPPADSAEVPEAVVLPATLNSPFSSFEFLLSIFVLCFGLIVVAMEVYLASKGVIKSEYIYKCIIITLIIVGAVVLVTAGYSNNQINAIIGILGSIAGYMLAKNTTQS